jgi:hypothetical protein
MFMIRSRGFCSVRWDVKTRLPGFVPHTSIFWSPHHFLWHLFSLAQTHLSATQTIRNWISLRFQWKTSEICLRCPVWITTFESLFMFKIHNDTYHLYIYIPTYPHSSRLPMLLYSHFCEYTSSPFSDSYARLFQQDATPSRTTMTGDCKHAP